NRHDRKVALQMGRRGYRREPSRPATWPPGRQRLRLHPAEVASTRGPGCSVSSLNLLHVYLGAPACKRLQVDVRLRVSQAWSRRCPPIDCVSATNLCSIVETTGPAGPLMGSRARRPENPAQRSEHCPVAGPWI